MIKQERCQNESKKQNRTDIGKRPEDKDVKFLLKLIMT